MKRLHHSFPKRRAILALFLLFSTMAYAQPAAVGTVTGRVFNEGTNTYLEGAVIRVEGTNIVTVSERGGFFRLQAPAGSQNLQVSYTGLDSQSVAVTVRPEGTTEVDVALTTDIYALEEFSVSGVREGNALAITLQRQAPNIKNVAATDAFGAPAANPGELLQRLPGVAADAVGAEIRQISVRGMPPDNSSIMIDGNRTAGADSASVHRWVPVDSLSTTNLERVELIKAPTPDMEADATGGFINLVSKRAFDRPAGRYISYALGSFWMDRDGNSPVKDAPGLDLATLGYSEVFSVLGGENNLGVLLNYQYRKTYTHQDEITHTFRPIGPEQPTFENSLQAREFSYPDYRNHFGGSIDYKISENSMAYFKFDTTKINRYQEFHGWSLSAGNNANNYQPGYSVDYTESKPVALSRANVFSGLFTFKNYSYQFTAGAQHKMGDLTLDYEGYYNYVAGWYPDRSSFSATASKVGYAIDRRNADPMYPEITQVSGPSIYDPTSYVPGDVQLFRNGAWSSFQGAQINLKKDFDTAVPTFVKTGLRYRYESNIRDWNTTSASYVGADGLANTADDRDYTPFVDQNYSYDMPEGRYRALPLPAVAGRGDPGDIKTLMDEHPEYFDVNYQNTWAQSFRNDGKAEESVAAAYVMGSVDFGKLGILAGVRVERTEVDTSGPVNTLTVEEAARRKQWSGPLTDEEELRRAQAEWNSTTTAHGQYQDVFPGAHFRYEPIPGLLARASYSTGITRPHKNNLIPGTTVNEENQRITVNNPELQAEFSDNFDVSLEYYFEPVGLFSIGAFLKERENFITRTESIVSPGEDNGFDGLYGGYTLSTPINVGFARVRGIEISYNQQFSFLGGFWKGFGIFANYTKLSTMGDFGGNKVVKDLAGFRPESGNFGISYVNYGFQVRMMANHQGRRRGNNASNPAAVQWIEARNWYDLKLQYSVNRELDIFLDVINVFDEPSIEREYAFGWPRLRYEQGTQYSVGLRGRF